MTISETVKVFKSYKMKRLSGIICHYMSLTYLEITQRPMLAYVRYTSKQTI